MSRYMYLESVANVYKFDKTIMLLSKILMNVWKASRNALRYVLTPLEATVAAVIWGMLLMPMESLVILVVC